MTTTPERAGAAQAAPAPSRVPWTTRVSTVLHLHPGLRLTGLLSAPMLWLVVAYLGSLAVMFAAAPPSP